MTLERLKPCPFCGGEASVLSFHNNFHNLNFYFVVCEKCEAETNKENRTKKQAIQSWNKRWNSE